MSSRVLILFILFQAEGCRIFQVPTIWFYSNILPEGELADGRDRQQVFKKCLPNLLDMLESKRLQKVKVGIPNEDDSDLMRPILSDHVTFGFVFMYRECHVRAGSVLFLSKQGKAGEDKLSLN